MNHQDVMTDIGFEIWDTIYNEVQKEMPAELASQIDWEDIPKWLHDLISEAVYYRLLRLITY